MSAEKKFWADIIGSMSPGWDVAVTALGSDTPHVSKQTTFIYVIDTHSGWVAAGSMAPEHFKKIHDDLRKDLEYQNAVKSSAAPIILKNSQSHPDKSSQAHMECVLAASCALTLTATYDRVAPTGLSGHWLYIVYKLKSGNSMGRPVYFNNVNNASVGFCDSDVLESVIMSALKNDLQGPSQVNNQVNSGGGALLHNRFKAQ